MKDIELLETCEKCGAHLTLMASGRIDDHSVWLVKRCLNCGGHFVTNPDGSMSVEEVVKICK